MFFYIQRIITNPENCSFNHAKITQKIIYSLKNSSDYMYLKNELVGQCRVYQNESVEI